MTTLQFILSIFQLGIVSALVIVILLQKTGADGLSGLSGGGHHFMSQRSSGQAISKLTIFLAAAFMINSLALAKIAVQSNKNAKSVIESIHKEQSQPQEAQVPLAQ